MSHKLALKAAAALFRAGFKSVRSVQASDRREIVRLLNQNGYARYDEMTADYLQHNARLLNDQFDGSMRKLIATANKRPDILQGLLQEFKGIGPVGASVFASEGQVAYPWLFPSISPKALALIEKSGKVIDVIDQLQPLQLARYLVGLITMPKSKR